ncbi:hypothetical protein IFR05_008745 [Cadophora sp. M221]|nr:hypothetical protein IFR05_008745 [Cadophora sp. M221]
MDIEMDQEISPFLLFPEKNIKPETPHLKLELALGRELTAGSRCYVLVTIHRAGSDSHNSPCILSWDQNDAAADLLLFQHTPDGLRQVEIAGEEPSSQIPSPLQTPFQVDGSNPSLRELAPGGKERFMMTMPRIFRDVLAEGEKYELVWPGSEIGIWDWGTKKEFLGRELGNKIPRICLPAAKVMLEFNKFGQGAREEKTGRVPPPIGVEERIPGAPKMSVTLECNKSVPLNGTETMKIIVLYEALAGISAITFHNFPFKSWHSHREGYRLYRRRANTNSNTWEAIIDDTTSFMIVDDPDVSVHVTQDENFASLRPGQTWRTSKRLQGQGVGILPGDVKVGDAFRFVFKGMELDWWDWGGSEDHGETIVKLPCFLKGRVVEPEDNGGRPKLVVPASNSVEFTIV